MEKDEVLYFTFMNSLLDILIILNQSFLKLQLFFIIYDRQRNYAYAESRRRSDSVIMLFCLSDFIFNVLAELIQLD